MSDLADGPATEQNPYSSYNHLKVGAMARPEPRLHAMLDRCPVGHSDEHGGFWLATAYDVVGEAARNTAAFSSSPEHGPGDAFPFSFPFRVPMIESDPPEHRDLRGPLQKLFSRSHAENLAPSFRSIVTNLIDGFIEAGEADLATQLTIPFPVTVMSDFLDIPLGARDDFRQWASDVVAMGAETPSFELFVDFIGGLHDERKASPRDDIPSMLLELEVLGRPITRDQWVGVMFLLITGGLETTSNGAALMFHYVAQFPEIRADLVERLERPGAFSPAIEELLRLLTPVAQHSRGVRRDIELGGATLREGEVLLLNWLAANRDEAVFPEPDEYRPDERQPNRHVAFGTGPHKCLGAHIARAELRVLFEELFTRLPDYEVIEDGVERYESLTRGMSHLPVRFTQGPRIGAVMLG